MKRYPADLQEAITLSRRDMNTQITQAPPPKVVSKSSVDWSFQDALNQGSGHKDSAGLFEMLETTKNQKFEDLLDQVDKPEPKPFSIANYLKKNQGNKRKTTIV